MSAENTKTVTVADPNVDPNIVKRRDYEDKIEDFAEIYDLIEQKLIEVGIVDPSDKYIMYAMAQVLMAFNASECEEQYDLEQQNHEMDEPLEPIDMDEPLEPIDMDEPLEPIDETPPTDPERRVGPNSQKFFFSHNSTSIDTAHNEDIYEVESNELPFNRKIFRTR